MTAVRWDRKAPLAIGPVLVEPLTPHQAELMRAFREAWRPAPTQGDASPSRPPIAVHEIRLARRKR